MRSHVMRQFGRRGILLVLLGLMWTFVGVGLTTISQQRFSADNDVNGGPLQFLDDYTPVIGGFWILGGLLALVGGFIRKNNPRDDYGFLGLSVPVFATFSLYLWSFAVNISTDGVFGRPNSWLPAVVYFVVFATVLFVARWPDPDDPHLPPEFRSDVEGGLR
ncbi:MAG: hypothetical protein AVDCRST_MAG68-5053 [uncultured Gemmatimonadetes bacterium]|uniref:Uncharacterized protein n=1 Tax=uncultured Gemmatimonadota bacterium TaxID=203437 RepID=A0A6J4MNQ8_9BACT|nr:MAG: hypothetical protein AVDCRST_MAG68-5053 [uncultured Gemmatimonadota bacterium]